MLTLPHSTAIRNWISNIEALPGFQTRVLEGLKNLPAEDKDCTLMFDGMSIHEQVLWDQEYHRSASYCDYGNYINLERTESTAKEALVFLLVSLNGKWKWAIAYFLKHSITSGILKEFILTALTLTAEAQLHVHAIVCDVEAVNCSTLNQLGCNIFASSFADLKNSFKHPVLNYEVKVFLDACHMLKLARNALADKKRFCTDEGNIEWKYIIQLHKTQQKLILKFKNKLSSQCVNWKENKMKVRYAAQTFSASVANALLFKKMKIWKILKIAKLLSNLLK